MYLPGYLVGAGERGPRRVKHAADAIVGHPLHAQVARARVAVLARGGDAHHVQIGGVEAGARGVAVVGRLSLSVSVLVLAGGPLV